MHFKYIVIYFIVIQCMSLNYKKIQQLNILLHVVHQFNDRKTSAKKYMQEVEREKKYFFCCVQFLATKWKEFVYVYLAFGEDREARHLPDVTVKEPLSTTTPDSWTYTGLPVINRPASTSRPIVRPWNQCGLEKENHPKCKFCDVIIRPRYLNNSQF